MNMNLTSTQKYLGIAALVIVIAAAGGVWYFTQPQPKTQLIVSTTSSLYETGFLDAVKKAFETKYSQYNISFINQGTALAIETAKRGDADMILVHDPAAETKFLTDGYGVNRKIVAYNFFIYVGPASDPANIKGMGPVDALKKIHEEGLKGNAIWVSRGDKSGTNTKEISLWKLAGLNTTLLKAERTPKGEPWYLEAGTTMTPTLQLTNQKNGYTITDLASFLKNSASGNIQLVKVVEAGKDTLNVYSAIACNPAKNTRGNFKASMDFINYLVSAEGQELFRTFGVSTYGQALFKPWLTLLSSNSDPQLIGWIKDYAYIQGSECPEAYRQNAGDLYK
jgi:tungstate transport system substrate-binding protein